MMTYASGKYPIGSIDAVWTNLQVIGGFKPVDNNRCVQTEVVCSLGNNLPLQGQTLDQHADSISMTLCLRLSLRLLLLHLLVLSSRTGRALT